MPTKFPSMCTLFQTTPRGRARMFRVLIFIKINDNINGTISDVPISIREKKSFRLRIQ